MYFLLHSNIGTGEKDTKFHCIHHDVCNVKYFLFSKATAATKRSNGIIDN